MANLISSLESWCCETQLLIDLRLSTFEALQLALPLSSTYFICNNLMIQLKPYQIRNIVYMLAFDLFRNEERTGGEGEKNREETETICCFSNSAVALPIWAVETGRSWGATQSSLA